MKVMIHLSKPSCPRKDGGTYRAGMTLIEILIAMGVLAFGLFGILTLFPLAIRNISTAVGRTTSGAVAKNTIASLQEGVLTLGEEEGEGNGKGKGKGKGPKKPKVRGKYFHDIYNSFPGRGHHFGLILNYYRKNGGSVGDGGPGGKPAFQVPRCLSNREELGDEHGNVIKPYWARGYGWEATFLPLSDDIDEQTRYRVQIAVWSDYGLLWEGNATFWGADGQDNDADGQIDEDDEALTVILELAPDEDPPRVRTDDYIRVDSHGIWYKIESVDGNIIKLASRFKHPKKGFKKVSSSIASRFKLVGVYETVVGPQD